MKRVANVRRSVRLTALLVSALFVVSACGSGGTSSTSTTQAAGGDTSSAAGTPKRGGSVVTLLNSWYSGSWPAGLDPATNPLGSANLSQQHAIFGGLFLLRSDKDGKNAKVVPYQAKSGTLSEDGKTFTIKLREGMKFTDGTPFNAEAVIWNFKRDTGAPCSCAPTWQLRKKDPFTSPDPLTVVVHMTEPAAALLNGFPARNVNWIASPSAYQKMGAKKFAIKPVGAGPFIVVSDTLSAKLELKRNPNYFMKGQPYLDKLTFTAIDGDQPAYQATLAGQAQAYEGLSDGKVIKQARDSSKLQVSEVAGASPYLIRFNTQRPPFNNKQAREAIYYATDWDSINKGVYGGKPVIVQGFTSPNDLFYHQKTPGYRTYDLDKAKALVKQVGGFSVTIDTISDTTNKRVVNALQTQWEKAGIKVNTNYLQLSAYIKKAKTDKWQVEFTLCGAWDPATGTSVQRTFGSTSPTTGVKDKHLDALLAKSVSTPDMETRDKAYQELAKYISDQAYGVFGFAAPVASVAAKGVHGPGLTTKIPALVVNPQIIWAEVWTENG